jgi:ribonuclease BN (tRNA processing enzyme)
MLRLAARAIGLILTTVVCGVLCPPARLRAQESTTRASAPRVVMLGTGTPNADPDRSGPAVAIVAGGSAYLVDAGAGVVRRAAAARRKGIEALDVNRLRIVFLTHLHSDHTLGLPDLMLSPWVLDRTAPLEIYGPPGTRAMVEHLRAAYDADIHNRIDGLEPANETGYRTVVHEIVPGVVYRDSNVTVKAFAVPHGDWKHAFAYRFEAAGHSVVVSGDTRASDSIVKACAGCDVLVHEVYSAERFTARPPEWQRYHARAHTSTTELADLASKAKPGLLVLYHQLFWGAVDDDLVREVRARYSGRVLSAHDLDVFP